MGSARARAVSRPLAMAMATATVPVPVPFGERGAGRGVWQRFHSKFCPGGCLPRFQSPPPIETLHSISLSVKVLSQRRQSGSPPPAAAPSIIDRSRLGPRPHDHDLAGIPVENLEEPEHRDCVDIPSSNARPQRPCSPSPLPPLSPGLLAIPVSGARMIRDWQTATELRV